MTRCKIKLNNFAIKICSGKKNRKRGKRQRGSENGRGINVEAQNENWCQFQQHFTNSFFKWKCFWCFHMLTIKHCNFLAKGNWHKSSSSNVAEIDFMCQFYQHFMSSFFVQKSFPLITVWLCHFLAKEYYWHKNCSWNFDEIDYRCQFQQHFMNSFFL